MYKRQVYTIIDYGSMNGVYVNGKRVNRDEQIAEKDMIQIANFLFFVVEMCIRDRPMVEKYAREYGISEYVNVLLAIIQVESGGTAEDVMQSSESLGLPPNSLDTES